jgi:hypothetical protein
MFAGMEMVSVSSPGQNSAALGDQQKLRLPLLGETGIIMRPGGLVLQEFRPHRLLVTLRS